MGTVSDLLSLAGAKSKPDAVPTLAPRQPGADRPAHRPEREHVDVRAAELEALREQRLEPDLPRPVVQADDEVAPPARPGAAGEVGREAGIVAPERLRLQARVEQLAWVSKV